MQTVKTGTSSAMEKGALNKAPNDIAVGTSGIMLMRVSLIPRLRLRLVLLGFVATKLISLSVVSCLVPY